MEGVVELWKALLAVHWHTGKRAPMARRMTAVTHASPATDLAEVSTGIEHMPVAAAQVEHPKTYDLKQILLEITQEENRGEQRLGHAGSPALCLGLRLRAGAETKAAAETSVPKHHPALENPSNIRGSAGGEGGGGRAGTGGTVGVGSGAPSRVPVSFSKTRRAIRESRALVRGIAHIFSPHALYVVTYPELSAQGRLHRMWHSPPNRSC